ncbi:carotenoid oxygenase family protein [Kitasatospora sp. NPDC088391]|uniref:carotenoid oxygenase family protein n=1 Tax=Kitasatospora sp. NPDC088391 TaxID=3364074 RepID=UPI003808F735
MPGTAQHTPRSHRNSTSGPNSATGPNSTTHLLGPGYRPAPAETTHTDLAVRGVLPPQLDGTFLRIGPNPRGEHDPAVRHAFAGTGMVHGLRLGGGRAHWYRNRLLRDDALARDLGELPVPGPRHGHGGEVNANLVRHAGRTLAVTDGALPLVLDAELRTVARTDFDATLPGGFCAHPLTDPVTGELHAVAVDPAGGTAVLLTVDTAGRVREARPVPVKGRPWMHAFALTARHTVLFDLPVAHDEAEARSGSPVPLAWQPDRDARIGIVPRDRPDAAPLWLDLPPCFVFHPVNAFEDAEGRITVDVIRHERAFDRDRLHPSESAPTLWRWTLDPREGAVVERQLDGRVQEFPRIDERRTGLPYRYAFTVELVPGDGAALCGPALLRHDLATGRTDRHAFGPGRQGGEAVFVPRDATAPEGDGWLLTLVYDPAADRSELLVLDTADFTGPPVAVVPLPVRVPHGFHARWVPAGW